MRYFLYYRILQFVHIAEQLFSHGLCIKCGNCDCKTSNSTWFILLLPVPPSPCLLSSWSTMRNLKTATSVLLPQTQQSETRNSWFSLQSHKQHRARSKQNCTGITYNTGISDCVDFFIDLTSIERPCIEFDKLIEVANFGCSYFTEVVLITNTWAHKAVYVRKLIRGMLVK